MRIFLDGCDGTGKSTLAKYLSERFNLDIFCLTKNSEKSIGKYKELLSINNVVHDRTFLSEMVYPPIFERDSWLKHFDVCKLIDSYSINDGIIVICTAPDEIIRKRINTRCNLEYQEIVDNISYINSTYKFLARTYDLLLVNTNISSLEEIGDEIERRLNNGKY